MSDTPYRSLWMHLCELEFRQGYVMADGVRTRYAEAGDPAAPPVLLLHGTGGHWETFAPNLPALAEHFHCVAIDMVGNGFSGKPDHDYEIPVYLPGALVGGEEHHEEYQKRRKHHLVQWPDAEPQDEQRRQGDLGKRPQGQDEGLEQVAETFHPAEDEAE